MPPKTAAPTTCRAEFRSAAALTMRTRPARARQAPRPWVMALASYSCGFCVASLSIGKKTSGGMKEACRLGLVVGLRTGKAWAKFQSVGDR